MKYRFRLAREGDTPINFQVGNLGKFTAFPDPVGRTDKAKFSFFLFSCIHFLLGFYLSTENISFCRHAWHLHPYNKFRSRRLWQHPVRSPNSIVRTLTWPLTGNHAFSLQPRLPIQQHYTHSFNTRASQKCHWKFAHEQMISSRSLLLRIIHSLVSSTVFLIEAGHRASNQGVGVCTKYHFRVLRLDIYTNYTNSRARADNGKECGAINLARIPDYCFLHRQIPSFGHKQLTLYNLLCTRQTKVKKKNISKKRSKKQPDRAN